MPKKIYIDNNEIATMDIVYSKGAVNGLLDSKADEAEVKKLDKSIKNLSNEIDNIEDNLGNAEDSIDALEESIAALDDAKQDKLTAGQNITIENDVINAKDTTYTAGRNITIENNVISAKGDDYYAGDGLTLTGTTFAIDPTVVATQSDLSNYSLTVDTGHSIELTIDHSTYVVSLSLKNSEGTVLGETQTIDLPLESVVVGGSYDSVNKKLILTLNNGNTIDIPVGDLVSGLQTEITVNNKLSSDLVDDTNKVNKFVTEEEKEKLDNLTYNTLEYIPIVNQTENTIIGALPFNVDDALSDISELYVNTSADPNDLVAFFSSLTYTQIENPGHTFDSYYCSLVSFSADGLESTPLLWVNKYTNSPTVYGIWTRDEEFKPICLYSSRGEWIADVIPDDSNSHYRTLPGFHVQNKLNTWSELSKKYNNAHIDEVLTGDWNSTLLGKKLETCVREPQPIQNTYYRKNNNDIYKYDQDYKKLLVEGDLSDNVQDLKFKMGATPFKTNIGVYNNNDKIKFNIDIDVLRLLKGLSYPNSYGSSSKYTTLLDIGRTVQIYAVNFKLNYDDSTYDGYAIYSSRPELGTDAVYPQSSGDIETIYSNVSDLCITHDLPPSSSFTTVWFVKGWNSRYIDENGCYTISGLYYDNQTVSAAANPYYTDDLGNKKYLFGRATKWPDVEDNKYYYANNTFDTIKLRDQLYGENTYKDTALHFEVSNDAAQKWANYLTGLEYSDNYATLLQGKWSNTDYSYYNNEYPILKAYKGWRRDYTTSEEYYTYSLIVYQTLNSNHGTSVFTYNSQNKGESKFENLDKLGNIKLINPNSDDNPNYNNCLVYQINDTTPATWNGILVGRQIIEPGLYRGFNGEAFKVSDSDNLKSKLDAVNPVGSGKFILNADDYFITHDYISGTNAVSFGSNHVTGSNAFAQGSNNYAEGSCSFAHGIETHAENDAAHAEGTYTRATGRYSHAEGYGTKASSYQSHAEGNYTIAGNYNAHAEGSYTYAGSSNAHAEGNYSYARGENSHAEGKTEFFLPNVSFRFYYFSPWVDGSSLVAELSSVPVDLLAGDEIQLYYSSDYISTLSPIILTVSKVNYTGNQCFIHTNKNSYLASLEGRNVQIVKIYNTASGDASHAEGISNIASGIAAHAEGYGTKASSNYQHTLGKFNIEDTNNTYVEIVGNGTRSNNKSNARTLDWSGNEVLAGTVEAQGFKVPSGDSDQFLKADGSVDSSEYALASDIPYVPTDLSEFNNDSGFITSSDIPTDVSDFTNDAGYITLNDLPTYSTVATTGDYDDLIDAPVGKASNQYQVYASGVVNIESSGTKMSTGDAFLWDSWIVDDSHYSARIPIDTTKYYAFEPDSTWTNYGTIYWKQMAAFKVGIYDTSDFSSFYVYAYHNDSDTIAIDKIYITSTLQNSSTPTEDCLLIYQRHRNTDGGMWSSLGQTYTSINLWYDLSYEPGYINKEYEYGLLKAITVAPNFTTWRSDIDCLLVDYIDQDFDDLFYKYLPTNYLYQAENISFLTDARGRRDVHRLANTRDVEYISQGLISEAFDTLKVKDVCINDSSVVNTGNGHADIKTNGVYDATSNKIATMSDLPTVPTNVSSFNNDAGYTTNVGTVTSVNNVSPVNGNVTISIPSAPVQDVQINGTSILSGSNANIVTNTAYNAISNKIATMLDLPTAITITTTSGSESVSDGTNTLSFGANAFTSTSIPTTYVSTINGNSGAITGIATDLAAVGYTLSGTVASGDTISDTSAISQFTNKYPITINGKRFEYQESGTNLVRYMNSSLNGAIIKLTIAEFNTSTNIITFVEKDVSDGVSYQTTPPTSHNTDGTLKFVVLSSAPATKYQGYLYYITD